MKIIIITKFIFSLIFISVQSSLIFILGNNLKNDSQPEHIREILTRNFPPITEHTLWRNYRDLNYKKAVYDGVQGPQWTIPLAEVTNDFNHIASPVPKVEKKRIIANELPPRTISPSSYDYPKRQNVIQITLPQSTMKTVTTATDPNNQMVRVPTGELYHGITTLPKEVSTFGIQTYRFKGKQINSDNVGHLINQSVQDAQHAEKRADNLLNQISNNFLQDKMIIPIVNINKSEKPLISFSNENNALNERKNQLRHSIVGAKAGLSISKLN